MKRLNNIFKIINFFAIAISIAISHYIKELAKDKFNNEILLFVIALVVITIGYEIIPIIFKKFFEIPFFKKMFLGNQYVEGTYLDIMFEDGKATDVGLSRIIIEDDKLRYGGFLYKIKGDVVGSSYRSKMIEMEYPIMKYTYDYKLVTDSSALLHGYGEIDFDERKGEPMHYTGNFIDFTNGDKVYFEGWKIRDKAILKDLDNPKERYKTIINFFKDANKLE